MKPKRVRIEHNFWDDPRLSALEKEVGNLEKAVGICVRYFSISANFMNKNARKHRLIPYEIWQISDLPDALIKCGWAERTSEGIVPAKLAR